jgi:hypothetical protein
MYINGILQYNILYLYYETKQEKDILKKRGFKFIKDYAYSIYNLENNVNYRLIQPKQIVSKFKKLYVNILNKAEIEPVYITQFINGKLTQQLITGKNKNDILFFNTVNVIYEVEKNKILQAPNLMDNKVVKKLLTDKTSTRKTIKEVTNDSTVKVEYEEKEHSYYNEVVDRDKLSYAMDNMIVNNLDLIVSKINGDYEVAISLYDDIFNKLLTALQKPAVVGTPPLLPNEVLDINQKITEIKQKINNTKTENYDIINKNKDFFNSYITSKVKSDEELEGMNEMINEEALEELNE